MIEVYSFYVPTAETDHVRAPQLAAVYFCRQDYNEVSTSLQSGALLVQGDMWGIFLDF